MPSNSKFTRDDNNNAAIRIMANDNTVTNSDSMFTTDDNGNTAVRVVFGEGSGGGGGDQHNLGWYSTPTALEEAHPTAEAGDWAIVGSTDTVWIWDTDNSEWVDSDKKGQVTSVNGQTGAVTLGINDVAPTQTGKSGYVLGTDGFVAGWVKPEIVQCSALPQASEEEVGKIYQYVGTTDANYTNGYFYKCVSDGAVTPTYSWTRIDVQPSSGGGGSREWAVTIDLPANSGLGWNAYPIYTITGGLPDGEYEFTWQVKCLSTSSDPVGVNTYNARIKIDNANHTVYGHFAPEIDGEWFPDGNTGLESNAMFIYSLFKQNGSDLMIFTGGTRWATDIATVDDTLAVPECFKITKFKNIETGEEYDITGELCDGNSPSYDTEYSGNFYMSPLQQAPTMPEFFTNGVDGFSDNAQYLFISAPFVANMNTAYCSELDVSLSTNSGSYHVIVENAYNTYIARVIEASGDLENAQILTTSNGYPYVYLNTTAGTSGTLRWAIGVKGSRTSVYAYMQTPSEVLSQLSLHNVGATVTGNNYGAIEQYKGTTTASYTNGYFYKATGTPVTVPAEYDVTITNYNDITVTANTSALITAIATVTGYTDDYVKQQMSTSNTFYLLWDSDNSSVLQVYISIVGWTSDNSIISCFTVSTTGSYSGALTLEGSAIYLDSHTEIQNGYWEQINVQPTLSTPSTMPTLLAASWSSNAQTVNVTGVTANNIVFVSPAPASATEYGQCGIVCTAQGSGTLTFECDSVPTNDLTVNVVIM